MYREKLCVKRAKVVKFPGTVDEEIVVNRRKNKFFLTQLTLTGTSWAKDVHVLSAGDGSYDSLRAKVLDWVANGELGQSSKAMALAAAGSNGGSKFAPADPADFNRCLLLLQAVPEINAHMHKVARLSDRWATLVDRWEEVARCFLNEVGWDWSEKKTAPETYKLMKELGL